MAISRRSYLAWTSACAALIAFEPRARAQDVGANVAADDVVVLLAEPTRLDRIGRVRVPVMINGRGPYLFVLDTGASRSVLSPSLVAELGLEPSNEHQARISGVTGSAIVPTVAIERLQAGALELTNERLPVITTTVLNQAQGILGVDGLAHRRLEIDFANNRVEITPSRNHAAPRGFLSVAARMRFGGLMTVTAQVGAVRAVAIIDTGAERSLGNLALQNRLAMRERQLAAKGQATVLGATAQEYAAESQLAPSILIGEAELRNLHITYGDLNVFRIWNLENTPAILLGMDLLGTVQRMIIDYRRAELWLQP
jgi:predicted aspartyl protease